MTPRKCDAMTEDRNYNGTEIRRDRARGSMVTIEDYLKALVRGRSKGGVVGETGDGRLKTRHQGQMPEAKPKQKQIT